MSKPMFVGLIAVLALAGCDKPAPRVAPIVLGAAPPVVGSSWQEEELTELDLMVDMGGSKVRLQQDKLEKKKLEILAVDGDRVTRARYTYLTVSKKQSFGTEAKDEPSPIEGKTYLLEAGTPIVVTTEGGPAPDDEVAAVRAAEKRFGKADQIQSLIAGKTFEPGRTVELPAAAVLEAMRDDPDDKINAATMSLTYRRMDGANARFDVTMTMAGEDDRGNQVDLRFSGTGLIEPATGEALLLDLQGPFKMSGRMNAEGTMHKVGKRL